MCRWLAYIGEPRLIEQFLYEGPHSLCEQAQHSHKAKLGVHGDGGGLGWYAKAAEPGLYRNPGPAWADPNLRELTRVIQSHVFFAHVRASTGAPNLLVNCHPFRSGRWLFMHNGQIGGYRQLRRRLFDMLPDDCFDAMVGSTDSELMFQMMLANGLCTDPFTAIRQTIREINALRRKRNIQEAFRATFAISDGQSVYAARWASDSNSPSMYINRTDGGTLLVSEPLDEDISSWTAVPANSFVRIQLRDDDTTHTNTETFLVGDAAMK
ncbi:MAG: class II glutamine amidotransferase [Woeseia sp.]